MTDAAKYKATSTTKSSNSQFLFHDHILDQRFSAPKVRSSGRTNTPQPAPTEMSLCLKPCHLWLKLGGCHLDKRVASKKLTRLISPTRSAMMTAESPKSSAVREPLFVPDHDDARISENVGSFQSLCLFPLAAHLPSLLSTRHNITFSSRALYQITMKFTTAVAALGLMAASASAFVVPPAARGGMAPTCANARPAATRVFKSIEEVRATTGVGLSAKHWEATAVRRYQSV